MSVAMAASETPVWRRARPWFVLLAIGLFVTFADISNGVLTLGDVDDHLRNLQIRHLLDTGAWYDMSLPFVQTPDVYVSPWSRLVDLPYFVLTRIFGLFAAPDLAFRLSTFVWSIAMTVLFSWLAASAMRLINGTGRKIELLPVAAAGFAMTLSFLEFTPGRTDHHNVQILCMVGMIVGLAAGGRRGAAVSGIAAALSIVTGLECLPFIVAAYAVLVVAHMLGKAGSGQFLRVSAISMLATALVSALAFLGPEGSLSVQCDAFSAPYIAAIAGSSALLIGASLFERHVPHPAGRLALYSFGGAAVLAVLAYAFPACLAGPYQMIDPVSKTLWLDRLWQEHGILMHAREGLRWPSVVLAMHALVLIYVSPTVIRAFREGRAGVAAAYAMATLALLLSLVLMRYVRFPTAFVPLFIPTLFASLQVPSTAARSIARSRAGTVLLIAPATAAIVAVAALFLTVPVAPRPYDAIDYLARDECVGEDMSALASIPPGRIMTPTGLGLPVAENRIPGISVGAIPFHRASPGIRRSMLAFTTSDPAVRRDVLAPFDYLAVCRPSRRFDEASAPLYVGLARDGRWPGLVPVPNPVQSRFQLYRIDHSALQ
ncbi:hypothetical protein [Sinorhizobium sp. BG8]|uniref:hypothetical protein n=1 Tax=Sinorhizobium sp. BG8 TaxID=2613773 RepID=UPI00193E7413|nr:hypothetical protein [Sinorhizobium sp. BG8]QRM56021.1 hypothetical protein F3Y30_16915 [Sinorhizobium sp. BG8]